MKLSKISVIKNGETISITPGDNCDVDVRLTVRDENDEEIIFSVVELTDGIHLYRDYDFSNGGQKNNKE